MVAAGHLPGRHPAAPPGGRCPGLLRARLLRPRVRHRHPARRLRRAGPGDRPGPRCRRPGRRAGDRPGRAVDGGDAEALRRRAGHRGRTGAAAHRLPHGGAVGRPDQGERPPGALQGRQPARVAPGEGPGPRPRDHARGRAADEAAQRQRRPHLPLPAAPGLPRPVRRVRPVGDRRVRPGDARLHRAGLAGQPRRRRPLDPGPARPGGPHGRAGQEPPLGRRLVARQRGRHRPGPDRHGRVDPRP